MSGHLDKDGKFVPFGPPPKPPALGTFQGVPRFFRVRVSATAASESGFNFHRLGSEFGQRMESLIPDNAGKVEWRKEVRTFTLLGSMNLRHGFFLFRRYYPQCAELIPNDRRFQFMAGVFDVLDRDKER